MSRQTTGCLLVCCGLVLFVVRSAAAQEAGSPRNADAPDAPAAADPRTAPGESRETPPSAPTTPDASQDTDPRQETDARQEKGLVRLTKDYDLWVDLKRKIVVVDGTVCLREGQLEMFACPKGTKEHESIVAVNSKAQFVHAALLAVGANPGTPVSFDPNYVAATGPEVEVFVLWKDHAGKKHQVPAQQWVKNVKTGKAMSHNWVFAGSGFWTDDQSGQRYYHGDAGDLICVSNFPTATLDLPVESSQATADLLFEAFTERIPPRGTQVRLVLRPKLAEKPAVGDSAK